MNALSLDHESNVAGSTSDSGPYIWEVLMPCGSVLFKIIYSRAGNKAMSASASGFVPGSGWSFFVEDLLNLLMLRIYAEVLGGKYKFRWPARTRNNDRSNPIAVQRCKSAMASAGIQQMKLILSTVI
jgi:hypothetical protein